MICNSVRLTEVCKECAVGNKQEECPTRPGDGNTIAHYLPPSSIFDLVPYNKYDGEKVICVDNHNCGELILGKVYTVEKTVNKYFGYVHLEEFKEYPLMWFSRLSFKRCKATYDGKEYGLYAKKGENQ